MFAANTSKLHIKFRIKLSSIYFYENQYAIIITERKRISY